jgi:preprotein translocase subunit Sss1
MLYRMMGKPQFFRISAKPTWDELSLEESDEVGM